MINEGKALVSFFCGLIKMASKVAGVSFGVVVLVTMFSSGCSDGKNQQLTYDNWHLMLEGEWMVKL